MVETGRKYFPLMVIILLIILLFNKCGGREKEIITNTDTIYIAKHYEKIVYRDTVKLITDTVYNTDEKIVYIHKTDTIYLPLKKHTGSYSDSTLKLNFNWNCKAVKMKDLFITDLSLIKDSVVIEKNIYHPTKFYTLSGAVLYDEKVNLLVGAGYFNNRNGYEVLIGKNHLLFKYSYRLGKLN